MKRYPNYCCQSCGERIGYIGRFLEWIFGCFHKCRPMTPSQTPARSKTKEGEKP